jgi:hypothetical protein
MDNVQINKIQKRLDIVVQILIGKAICMEPGISVSVVSGYGLDDRAIEVRSPAEAKKLFF